MIKCAFMAGIITLSLIANATQAAVLYSFEQTGTGVSGSLSGSLDISDSVFFASGGNPGGLITPSQAILFSGGADFVDSYLVTSAPDNFGPGLGLQLATSTSGSVFGVNGGIIPVVALPAGYTSGDILFGSIDFAGETFASLGVETGDYVFFFPNDTVTIRFSSGVVGEVPLPATLPLLLSAFSALGFGVLRRRSFAS